MLTCPHCGEDNPAKFRLCGYCGGVLSAVAALAPHEVRKTVTIVFCDLVAFTALGERLDPEALHEVKSSYFAAMQYEIARHGGKIEKYIGDALMAVFGLPRAHEDDALRAVRAAFGMQAALTHLNEDLQRRYGVTLANRTGVNTGEVVANDDPSADQKLATGDAVNVAARLEQAAPTNQIYLGEITYRLVRDAVEAEPVEPLELKGKAQRVPAFRLVSAQGLEGNLRRQDTPIVGRDAELAGLHAAFVEAVQQRTIRTVTVVGDAGLGKSRLVHELVERVGSGARVLRGRCLPYGDGITFWPLLMMVREAAGMLDTDSPEAAQAKLLQAVGDADVADRLASAAGLSAATFPLREINWAARKFLEHAAAGGPVVVLVDDIHWAETAFLELLEHVQQSVAQAPILLLATARHDLIEERPDWGTGPGTSRVVLAPLSDDASAQVVANLLGAAALPQDVVARIVGAAEGNPLYAEQMLSMLIDSGALRREDGLWVRADAHAEITVPPTIHALLEARLDRLGRSERAAVEPASVIGLEFPRSAAESLAPDAVRPAMPEHLSTLERKQFIRPSPTPDEEAAYRFHHHLVRDTVYNGLLKRARATLHIEFVRWADRLYAGRNRMLEFEEILGYHLEQAHRYLRELGALDKSGHTIGADGGQRLARAARRAFARGDMHAADNLYGRAVALFEESDLRRLALLPEFAEVLTERGDFSRARSVLAEAAAAAERAGDRRTQASAALIGMLARLYSGDEAGWGEETLRIANDAIPGLESEQAHDELALAWRMIGFVHGIAGRYGLNGVAVAKSMAHARQAGNQRLVARGGMAFATSALFGSTPVPEAIAQCERLLSEGLGDRQVESVIACKLAQLRAMNGEFEAARATYHRARAVLRDLGSGVNAAATGLDLLMIETLAGDLAAAERGARADHDYLSRLGETFYLATMAALLARAVRDSGRDDEALALTRSAEESASADDIDAQVLWRAIRAPIVARAGDIALAQTLAEEALALARDTEAPLLQADTLCELATVLSLAGREAEANARLDEAVALYLAKGDRVSAARWRADAA